MKAERSTDSSHLPVRVWSEHNTCMDMEWYKCELFYSRD